MNPSFDDRLFDLSYLNQIFQGNSEMINNIIQLFLDQVPHYVGEMMQCLEKDDLTALHPLAHKAKSSIAMLGLKQMEVNIIKVEKYSKHNMNLHEIPVLMLEIHEECNMVYSQLREVLKTNNAA